MLQTQMMPFAPLSNTNQSRDDYFLGAPDAAFAEQSTYNSYFPVCDGTLSVPSYQQQQKTHQYTAAEEPWQRFYHFPQSKSPKVDVTQSLSPSISDASRRAVLLKNIAASSVKNTDEVQVEDVDDDEFLEEEYAEAYREHMIPDSPTRLLHFIRKVTLDVQDRFARNKGQEGYCDVYEERFKTTLSGRELYYADLLALASNGEATGLEKQRRKVKNRPKCDDRQNLTVHDKINRQCNVTCHNTHTSIPCGLPHRGQEMKSAGLGPLEELFTPESSQESTFNKSRRATFSEVEAGNSEEVHLRNSQLFVPMAMRKLPQSFWKQPALHEIRRNYFYSTVGHTPDFSDLYEHWTGKH